MAKRPTPCSTGCEPFSYRRIWSETHPVRASGPSRGQRSRSPTCKS